MIPVIYFSRAEYDSTSQEKFLPKGDLYICYEAIETILFLISVLKSMQLLIKTILFEFVSIKLTGSQLMYRYLIFDLYYLEVKTRVGLAFCFN